MCRKVASLCLLALPLVTGQSDGNPHNWDRLRRCDHVDYSPPCGACEGIGGIARSDKKDDIDIVKCTVEESTTHPLRPVWGDPFTELASHEVLIGKKNDPACFQAFPSNDSTATNCYKPQEVQIWSEMKTKKALVLKANQGGNAWGLFGNVSSIIYHQGPNMWIVNHLPLGVTQTICTLPREGGDPAKPAVGPVQYNWVDNLFFVATETLDVEYGVGTMKLDHWAFGPHHAWTDPKTGLIVRMWQPFNGLQIFTPGNWQQEITEEGQKYLAELAADGKTAPKAALPKGSTFRIKCGDDGFNQASAQTPKADAFDLKRARTKVPRAAYKGNTFDAMSSNLNKWLLKQAPKSRACEDFSVEELQRLQVTLFMLRDPELDGVYQQANDARRIRKDVMNMSKEWDQLNTIASHDPELARMHRDGHCHEAVMWYVHHLPADARASLKDKAILPLLPHARHSTSKPHAATLRRAYEEKVSCASCHSFVYPSTAIVV
jgi:hypothetical protein